MDYYVKLIQKRLNESLISQITNDVFSGIVAPGVSPHSATHEKPARLFIESESLVSSMRFPCCRVAPAFYSPQGLTASVASAQVATGETNGTILPGEGAGAAISRASSSRIAIVILSRSVGLSASFIATLLRILLIQRTAKQLHGCTNLNCKQNQANNRQDRKARTGRLGLWC